MNILNKLKSLFNISSHDIYGLMNIKDMAIIPKLEDIHDEKTLKLITKYKKEYHELLKKKQILSTIKVHEEIRTKLEMYTNCLLNICNGNNLRDDLINYNIFYDQDITMIEALKLKEYLQKINALSIDILSRLIALQNLYSKKKNSFNKQQKEILLTLINNLIITYTIFENQKMAIHLECDAYLKNISLNNNSNEKINEEIFLIRKTRAKAHAKFIMPKTFKTVEKLKLSPIAELITLEIELEKYVYLNQHKVTELKSFLQECENISNPKDVLKEISSIERIFIIYATYGRNIIQKNDLEYLYTLKFNQICKLPLPITVPNIEQTNILEINCYCTNIAKIIDTLLKGNNPFIPNELIPYVSSILKENNVYEPINILRDPLKFNFVLSITESNGLTSFFNNYQININDYKEINFYNHSISNLFSWETKIPIKSLCWLIKYQELPNYPIYDLYEKLFPKTDIYELPEGLTSIDADYSRDYVEFIIKISIDVAMKTIKLPDSMISWYDNLLIFPIKGIILNKNICNLTIPYLNTSKIDIIIPHELNIFPEIENIHLFSIPNINNLIFEDYELSSIINDKKEFLKLIKSFLIIKLTNIDYLISYLKEYGYIYLNIKDIIDILFTNLIFTTANTRIIISKKDIITKLILNYFLFIPLEAVNANEKNQIIKNIKNIAIKETSKNILNIIYNTIEKEPNNMNLKK